MSSQIKKFVCLNCNHEFENRCSNYCSRECALNSFEGISAQ